MSSPLGLALPLSGPVAHCAVFSVYEVDHSDAYLAGPLRLANARVSITQPSMSPRTDRSFHLPTTLIFWKTRGYPTGRELRWNYGARSAAALRELLTGQKLSPCCQVGGSV